MRYFLFLDESGDHGLKKINPQFPVLVLCGILISEGNYNILCQRIDSLKMEIWGRTDVIFHSREIRKQENDFVILSDKIRMQLFVNKFNAIVAQSEYRIIAAAIRKEEYKNRYANPFETAYEKAMSFIIERAVFSLDELQYYEPDLSILIEARGRNEDQALAKHIDTVKQVGTGFVGSSRIQPYGFSYTFLMKSLNTQGLQFADLLAYPISRYVLNRFEENRNFEILKEKFYKDKLGRFSGWGLKIFP